MKNVMGKFLVVQLERSLRLTHVRQGRETSFIVDVNGHKCP